MLEWTSSSSALLPFFGEGSPTKIDKTGKIIPLFKPLKSGGPSEQKGQNDVKPGLYWRT